METDNNETSGYHIVESESAPHGDVYELEIDYFYDVIDNRTGKSVMRFQGKYSASLGDSSNWENEKYSGTDKVEISEDGKFVIVYDASGCKPERIKLPD